MFIQHLVDVTEIRIQHAKAENKYFLLVSLNAVLLFCLGSSPNNYIFICTKRKKGPVLVLVDLLFF